MIDNSLIKLSSIDLCVKNYINLSEEKLLVRCIKREELENSKNPFSSIIITQLNALKCKKQSIEMRYKIKFDEIKRLYKKGFSADIIRKLYKFLDALIRLPLDFDQKLNADIFKFEEEKYMAYVSISKIMMEIHVEKRTLEKRNKEIAVIMMQKNQPIDLVSEITGLSKKELLVLSKQAHEKVAS